MRAMVEIAATAAVASEMYARMERNLAIVRHHLGKPLTLSDKVLLGHLDDPEHAGPGSGAQLPRAAP